MTDQPAANFADFYDAELARHNAHFRRAAAVGQSDRVLDIGCGAGQTTRDAARAAANGRALGVDLSATMLELARRRSAAELADIEANIDQTYFAWFGRVDNPQGSYWRVTGPTIIMEFSLQSLGGDSANHLHNMYPDPTNYYGAAWAVPE